MESCFDQKKKKRRKQYIIPRNVNDTSSTRNVSSLPVRAIQHSLEGPGEEVRKSFPESFQN